MARAFPDMSFINSSEMVAGNIIQNSDPDTQKPNPLLSSGCLRANAARQLFWEPNKVKAAVVTCGGLCPGLNSIIRGVTKCLWNEYGVREILGITAGYNGLSDPETHPPVKLTEEMVRDIHMKGGSIIKAARGGFDAEKICDNLQRLGITVLFLVGGDGTQFAGHLLYEAARKRRLAVSIVGIPKSIDNDVVLFDRTFGFDTAVAKASEVIRNALVEASSCDRGVGIVKLMGRDSGFVAMHAATAADVVDLCMIPEVKVDMKDVIEHVDATLAKKKYMVIAVAEGAGQELVSTGKQDDTGHTVYGDIGVFLKDTLNKHLKASGGRTFYIDPSYIIRSVPITPNDHIYCVRLANDAVHTAMRGYTGVCVGAMHNVVCMLPSRLIASGKKKVRPHSSSWQGCVQTCNMPAALTGLGV
mmetsp:Transcript_20291/g.48093  ORF Transcript_20291/g.48093 Transcript_20291/m.48093 type:complete len:415 (+) Transcript_20291:167-1411(+)|eukprot:CAMPEP_0181432980 /NCGR_PEP_ID=MMETSP1110-20121109/19052_1 /TAXON_ID=174948 /ORGANISM="Symbiodinium sp., Strain CCMP421" /LENGTH=414 /DNA_ID=CAMNT_0023556411 /DNA_START=137 /DNA_END=1381 /DNA_ORIENTATION=+